VAAVEGAPLLPLASPAADLAARAAAAAAAVRGLVSMRARMDSRGLVAAATPGPGGVK
jgi:hypothetical protein